MDEELIELTDEETGESESFIYLMTLERGQTQYAVLVPAEIDEDEEDEEVGVFFMQIREDGEDEYTFIPLEDEALIDELFAEYIQILDEEEAAEDEEE